MDEVAPELNVITGEIVDAAIKVHKFFGPGMRESVYARTLAYELGRRGRRVVREAPVDVRYEGLAIGDAFKADLIVDDAVVVEIKATSAVTEGDVVQTYTYLRFTGHRVGLLINFGQYPLKDGIRRVANPFGKGPFDPSLRRALTSGSKAVAEDTDGYSSAPLRLCDGNMG